MNPLWFIVLGIFIIFMVYTFYPWIQYKIKPFMTTPQIEASPLDKPSTKQDTTAEKEWAFTDFSKRFVFYIAQPILHGFS